MTACSNVATSTEAKNTQNSQVAETKQKTISWKSYDKKYVTLLGIKYPSNFFIDDSNAIEIRSSEIPFIKNNECFFTAPCAEDGLMVSIGITKPYNPEFLENTKYPNIKKVNTEKTGTPQDAIKNYNYREYLYLANNEQLPYLIQIYEKNFQGDSEGIINEILSSLHE